MPRPRLPPRRAERGERPALPSHALLMRKRRRGIMSRRTADFHLVSRRGAEGVVEKGGIPVSRTAGSYCPLIPSLALRAGFPHCEVNGKWDSPSCRWARKKRTGPPRTRTRPTHNRPITGSGTIEPRTTEKVPSLGEAPSCGPLAFFGRYGFASRPRLASLGRQGAVTTRVPPPSDYAAGFASFCNSFIYN